MQGSSDSVSSELKASQWDPDDDNIYTADVYSEHFQGYDKCSNSTTAAAAAAAAYDVRLHRSRHFFLSRTTTSNKWLGICAHTLSLTPASRALQALLAL